MRIRTKLSLGISLLLGGSMGVLGYGVVLVSGSLQERDAVRQLAVIVNSVERAAQDALIQKDDILLISYINFLRQQSPALSYARIQWSSGERTRTLSVGQATGALIDERLIQVSAPDDASRRVAVAAGIDREALRAEIRAGQRRLIKIIAGVAAGTLLIGALFAIWFARSLTAPLEAMVGLAAEIGGGKLGRKLEVKSSDELGALIRVFNRMSERLEELDEAKKTFVSAVTHELRSPLGAIESFLHLVDAKLRALPEGAGKESRDYLARIQANVQRLSGFITDLLDVAKIERGKMECVLRPMKIQELAVEVSQFFEAKAAQQGVSVSQAINGVPAVNGDPERLRQVLVNLVSNALKFTEKGGRVTIAARERLENSLRWVEVSVTDTGRGMDQNDLNRLFAAFSQGRNVGQGVAGAKGTGLGLYICKSIVEQHGGRIGVDSHLGRGTQVSFTLKAA